MKEVNTATIELLGGISLAVPNNVTKKNKKDGFYVSYNNRSLNEYGCSTTALYIKETAQFLILNGNHTLSYKDCSDLTSHVDYFYDNINLANYRSEHGSIWDGINYKKGGY